MTEMTYLELAARILNVPPHQLWDYREGLAGIAFRTPDGYRHTYRFDELENAMPYLMPLRKECRRSLSQSGIVPTGTA